MGNISLFPRLSCPEKMKQNNSLYILDVVTLSGIVFGKQKVDITFNFNKEGVIDFTKISKMTMCWASEVNS